MSSGPSGMGGIGTRTSVDQRELLLRRRRAARCGATASCRRRSASTAPPAGSRAHRPGVRRQPIARPRGATAATASTRRGGGTPRARPGRGGRSGQVRSPPPVGLRRAACRSPTHGGNLVEERRWRPSRSPRTETRLTGAGEVNVLMDRRARSVRRSAGARVRGDEGHGRPRPVTTMRRCAARQRARTHPPGPVSAWRASARCCGCTALHQAPVTRWP